MKAIIERDFTTYPRQFKAYRWFKPLLTGLLFVLLYFLFVSLLYLITNLAFHTTVSSSGYDDLDFYSATGAFFNGAMGAIYIPSLLLAALIVKDRPLSSYFSSGGGWRWKSLMRYSMTISARLMQSTTEKMLPETCKGKFSLKFSLYNSFWRLVMEKRK